MNPDSNNSNVVSDEEMEDDFDGALKELNKFAEIGSLQSILDDMRRRNKELIAKARQLKRRIESMIYQTNVREEINEALSGELKYLKDKHALMTEHKTKYLEELITSDSFSQMAYCCAIHSQSQQAQPPPQPQTTVPSAPSTSGQPPNEQPDGPKSSDPNPEN